MLNKKINFYKDSDLLLKNSNSIKQIIVLLVIYGVAVSSIIRANYSYIDDIGRVMTGRGGWDNFSRYTSNFLSSVIHADSHLNDISPLTQYIALLFVVLSGVIIIKVYKADDDISLWDYIALIPLGLSPYFLECISYKYDSPYMALSILASVAPLLFCNKNRFLYFGMIVVGTLVMCTTYQAASGIFPMLVVFLAFKHWNQGDSIKKVGCFTLLSATGYLVGCVFFKVVMMKPAETHVSNSVLPIDNLLDGFVDHLVKYYQTIYSDFKKEWVIFICIILIGYIYCSVRDSARNKGVALLVNIVSVILMCLLMFGLYPVLEKPSYSPRAMYGMGVFVSLLCVAIASAKKIYISKIAMLAISWSFVVFAFVYGNVLVEQREYEDFRMNLVIQDLNDIEELNGDEDVYLQITGTVGHSPVIQRMPQDYEMLKRLVPITYRGDWYWGQYKFYRYYGLKNIIWDETMDLTSYELSVIKDSTYHTIKGNDKYILIELK